MPSSAGSASQACSARWPAMRSARSASSDPESGASVATARSSRARSARTPGPPASAASSAASARSGAGFKRGGVAVPPPAVLAPHRVDDELGLVVDRPQVGPGLEPGRRAHRVDGVVEPAAGVHDRQRLVDQGVEQVRRVGEGLADPVGPHDGEAVPGQEELGVRAPSMRRSASAHSLG